MPPRNVVACVMGLLLALASWQAAWAQEAPKVVVVTRDATGVQTWSSRNPGNQGSSAQATSAQTTYPTAVAGVSVSRPAPGMSREQVGSLIRTMSESLPPEQVGCLVEAATAGMQMGLLPRDVHALSTADLQWLAQRCHLGFADLAPVAAELIAGSAPALVMPTPTMVPVEQRLDAMRAATASSKRAEPEPSAPLTPMTLGLLALSLAGALAAGVGIGQLITRGQVRVRAPSRRPEVPYRYSVSKPPSSKSPPRRPPAPLRPQLPGRARPVTRTAAGTAR